MPAPKALGPEPEPNYVAWREASQNVGIDDEGRAAILQVSGRMVVIAAGEFDGVQIGEPAEAQMEYCDSTITSHLLHIVHVAPRECMAIVTFWCTPPRFVGVHDADYVLFSPRKGRPVRQPENLKPDSRLEQPELPTNLGVHWSKWGVDEAFVLVGQLVALAATGDKFCFLVNLELAEAPPIGSRLAAPEMTDGNDLCVVVVRHYHLNDNATQPVEQLGCYIDAGDVKYEPAKGMHLVLPK